jgi:hypothetical protein
LSQLQIVLTGFDKFGKQLTSDVVKIPTYVANVTGAARTLGGLKTSIRELNNPCGQRTESGVEGSGEIFNDYNSNTATGKLAHAEGQNAHASGYYAHAEGNGSKASGSSSHAENQSEVTTYGAYAHSEGVGTVAATRASHVQGCFNIIDNSTTAENQFGQYAHVVGNGTSNSNRSNAHTLDWYGNAWYAGSGKFHNEIVLKGGKKLVTENVYGSTPSYIIFEDGMNNQNIGSFYVSEYQEHL